MNPNSFSTKNAADWIAFDRKYCVRVGVELILRAFDRATPPILWCVFAATFFRLWFNEPLGGSFGGAARTFVFLTFASVWGHAFREASCNWREFPYWLDTSTQKARNQAVSTPILAAAIALSFEFFPLCRFSGLPYGGYFAASTFLGLALVDVLATRWARKFGETSARNFRALFDETTDFKSSGNGDLINNSSECRQVERVGEIQETDETKDVDKPEDEVESGVFVSSQRRTRETDGSERIVGESSVEFEDGAEIAVLCLSFCPPFEGTPTFEFEQISGPDVDWKTTSVQSFGVRLEAKRRLTPVNESFADDESDSTRVEYFATFPPVKE